MKPKNSYHQTTAKQLGLALRVHGDAMLRAVVVVLVAANLAIGAGLLTSSPSQLGTSLRVVNGSALA